jgi:formate dehydrogenase subunit gamma
MSFTPIVADVDGDPAPSGSVERFALVERLVHWANALWWSVLLATAAVLYVGSLSALVGRRQLIETIHVVAGLSLPAPLLAGLLGPWRRPLARDLRRLARWLPDDTRWLRSWGRAASLRLGKFNGGQKLNTAFIGGAMLVMGLTGAVMYWFEPFSDAWRTGATFVHDWGAIAAAAVIVGHIAKALSEPEALRSMVGGKVPATWAAVERPRWWEEVRPPARR